MDANDDSSPPEIEPTKGTDDEPPDISDASDESETGLSIRVDVAPCESEATYTVHSSGVDPSKEVRMDIDSDVGKMAMSMPSERAEQIADSLLAATPTHRPQTGVKPLEITQSADDVYELLSARRRRLVIQYLDHHLSSDETVDVGTLAEFIAAKEQRKSRDEIDAAERKSAYVSLTQRHLSQLAAASVVIWDDQAGRVGRGQSVEELARLISLID